MNRYLKSTWHALPATANIAFAALLTEGARDAAENELNWSNGLMMFFGAAGSTVSTIVRSQVIKRNYEHNPAQTTAEAIGRVGLQVSIGVALDTNFEDIIDRGNVWMIMSVIFNMICVFGYSRLNDLEIIDRYDLPDSKPPSILPWRMHRFEALSPFQKNAAFAGWGLDRVGDFLSVFFLTKTMQEMIGADVASWVDAIAFVWILRKVLPSYCNLYSCSRAQPSCYDNWDQYGDFADLPSIPKGHVLMRRMMLYVPAATLATVVDDLYRNNFSGDELYNNIASIILSLSFILLFEKSIPAERLRLLREADEAEAMGLPPDRSSLLLPINGGAAGGVYGGLVDQEDDDGPPVDRIVHSQSGAIRKEGGGAVVPRDPNRADVLDGVLAIPVADPAGGKPVVVDMMDAKTAKVRAAQSEPKTKSAVTFVGANRILVWAQSVSPRSSKSANPLTIVIASSQPLDSPSHSPSESRSEEEAKRKGSFSMSMSPSFSSSVA